MDNINIHRVLVAPLDWGLGHATRCIALIRSLQELHYEVLIAADGAQAALLTGEFPELTILYLKGYHIKYARTVFGLYKKLIIQIPRIVKAIHEEHFWLQDIITTYQIDLVISDNRYGLYSDKIPCIFMTHQLIIKAPFAFIESILRKINYHYINRFTTCWVPDAAGEKNIAGLLSHPRTLPKIPTHYLGLLARVHKKKSPPIYHYCFLISGPEPQRSRLESLVLKALPKISGKILLIRGLPESKEQLTVPKNTRVYNHLSTSDIQDAIQASEMVVCRSGYTSLMELICLQKKAFIIPTPGQTEQEYLSKKLMQESIFYSSSQKNMELLNELGEAKKFKSVFPEISIFTTKTLEGLLNNL